MLKIDTLLYLGERNMSVVESHMIQKKIVIKQEDDDKLKAVKC